MPYRLLALDIDGTLINSKGELTERTIRAIRLAQSCGALVCLVSGRRPRGMRGYAAALGLDGPLIACNGGVVVDAQTMTVLHSVTIPKTVVDPIIQVWEEAGISFFALRPTTTLPDIYYCQIPTWEWEAEWLAGEGEQAVRVTSLLGITDWEPTHLHFGHLNEMVRQAAELARPYIDPNCLRAFHVETPAGFGYFDIYPVAATKTHGLRFLGDFYGLAPEEMVAVGDQFNDLDMIEFAGLGVAMGNAPEAVQERADLVIGHHDEDGLARFIEQLVKDGYLGGTAIPKTYAQTGDAR